MVETQGVNITLTLTHTSQTLTMQTNLGLPPSYLRVRFQG